MSTSVFNNGVDKRTRALLRTGGCQCCQKQTVAIVLGSQIRHLSTESQSYGFKAAQCATYLQTTTGYIQEEQEEEMDVPVPTYGPTSWSSTFLKLDNLLISFLQSFKEITG